MPDRLVDLHERLVRKVADIQKLMDASRESAPESLRRHWDELAAIVREQTECLGEIARRTQELSSLSAFLQTDYEREKAQLARKLHDELGGILTPAKMDLAWLQTKHDEDPQYSQRMARLDALIDRGIDLKRRIIEDLHPSLLDHLGLAAAVQWYANETCGEAGIDCKVVVGTSVGRLASDLEIAVFRLVQESLSNVVRHAKARHAEVRIDRVDEGLQIAVSDDGMGIADVGRARKSSHGLSGMSQRARALNGTFAVQSREGGGTRIEVFVPLEAQAARAGGKASP